MVFRAYETFLLSNASQITAVESSFRSLTYFLPGRFKDAELAGEAIYSAMNLLGLYHDEILKRLVIYTDVSSAAAPQRVDPGRAASLPAGSGSSGSASGPLLPYTPSSHARYTNYYSGQSPLYKAIARLLVVVGYTELLAEMVARRKMPRDRAWDVVLGIEGLKASLRLALYHLTSSRLSINPPMPEREVDPEMLQKERNDAHLLRLQQSEQQQQQQQRAGQSGGQATPSTSSILNPNAPPRAPKDKTWTGSRTKYVRPSLSSLRPRVPSRNAGSEPATGRSPSRPTSRSGSSSRISSRSQSRSGVSSSDDEVDSETDSDTDSSEETLVDPTTGQSTTTTATPWTESSINEFLTTKALSKEDVMKPDQLVRPLGPSKRAVAAEYLYVLRPLFYVLALKRWGTRRWEPWTISLAVEYVSHRLRQAAYSSPTLAGSSGTNKGLLNPMIMGLLSTNPVLSMLGHLVNSSTSAPKPVSQVEEAEWAKRKRAFAWYLLRGPLWHWYTRVRVMGLCNKLEGKMLLGILAAMVKEYVPLVDDLYFYVN